MGNSEHQTTSNAEPAAELADLRRELLSVRDALRDRGWMKVVPILLSVFSTLLSTFTVYETTELSKERAAMEKEKRQEDAAFLKEKQAAEASASKRDEARMVSAYMEALVSENTRLSGIALASVKYAVPGDLGLQLENIILRGGEESVDGPSPSAEAVAETPATPAAAPATEKTAEYAQNLTNRFYALEKETRLRAFQEVLQRHRTNVPVISAILREGATGNRNITPMWNAVLLVRRLDEPTTKGVAKEIGAFMTQAERVLTGTKGKSQLEAARRHAEVLLGSTPT